MTATERAHRECFATVLQLYALYALDQACALDWEHPMHNEWLRRATVAEVKAEITQDIADGKQVTEWAGISVITNDDYGGTAHEWGVATME